MQLTDRNDHQGPVGQTASHRIEELTVECRGGVCGTGLRGGRVPGGDQSA
ncbi:hypothetical protein [Verrucosispora sioxanthis]|nr:hypothetical protein [Verrucosispora sioxanthis]